MKVKCPVIEDLLPLYIDSVCSEESREIVEEHLKECEACRAKFKVQKSEIVVDNDIIKENLKSKEPFKKIKRSWIISVASIIIGIPLLYLSLVEIGGDGVGFSALYGRYKTERFLTVLEKGNFENAASFLAFGGGEYGNQGVEKENAKEQWISAMQKLKDDGIEITAHKRNRITTDDTFTSGYVDISVKNNDKTYNFSLWIAANTSKLEPGNLQHIINGQLIEPSEAEKKLAERISKVICTFYPG